MNRLKYSKVYLVGPMDSNREGGREVREEITPFLQDLGIIILDPYKKPILGMGDLEDDKNHVLVQDALKNGRFDEVTRRMKTVRNVDLRCVDSSDFIIVDLNLEKRPCGTWEEIFTTNRQKKPILIKCESKKNLPPWLFAVCPHELFFETWKELENYLVHIDKDEEIDTMGGRWVFFDLEDQIKKIHGIGRPYILHNYIPEQITSENAHG